MLGKNGPILPKIGKFRGGPDFDFAKAWQKQRNFAKPWQIGFSPQKPRGDAWRKGRGFWAGSGRVARVEWGAFREEKRRIGPGHGGSAKLDNAGRKK